MEMNFLALLVAALVPMLLGFIWYHEKVFGKSWMAAAGMTDEKIKSGNMALILGVTFLFSLMIAYVMNIIAIHDGFISGATAHATNYGEAEPGSEMAKWLEYYQTNLAAANHTFKHGAFHGALIGGLFIAVPVLAINALFERKGFKYIAVNAGYWIVCLGIMGGIVAAWH